MRQTWICVSSKSFRRKRTEIIFRSAAFDHRCHYLRSDRSEQDAVTEVAGGYVIAGSGGGAENGQGVGSSWAEAGPVFENFAVAQLWNQVERCAMKALNCRDVGALVESGFFDGRAHQKASVATGDQIDGGRADYVFDQRGRGHQKAQHLSFYGMRGKGVWSDLACPCSGAVDDFSGW